MTIMADKQVYTNRQEQLVRIAKALGHPARVAIMQFLARQTECYFGDIHEELPIAKATVSQHLTELKEAGLRQGTVEPPKVRYCINPDGWRLARTLFVDPRRPFDRSAFRPTRACRPSRCQPSCRSPYRCRATDAALLRPDDRKRLLDA